MGLPYIHVYPISPITSPSAAPSEWLKRLAGWNTEESGLTGCIRSNGLVTETPGSLWDDRKYYTL